MKILHVNTIDTGGAAIAAIRLHYLLLDNHIDSKILFLKRTGTTNIKEAYYFEDLFSFRFFFKLKERLNALYNRRFTFYQPDVYFNGPDSLFNLTKHELFAWADVIHLHWVVKFLDWRKVFAYKSKKFVWTLHDMNPLTGGEHYQTGYNNAFSIVGKWNIDRKKKAISHQQLTIVSPSKWLNGIAKKSEVFKECICRTIKNPVNPTVFSVRDKDQLKQQYLLPADKKIILFVAENPDDQRKGYSYLLKALDKIKDKENYHLAIIGKTTNQLTVIHSTSFGTIKEEDKLCDLYNTADLFVIPSVEDNLPNTVSESLLCGTPVAGFNRGGIPDMVKNSLNGYLSDKFEDLDMVINLVIESKFDPQNVRNTAITELNPEYLLNQFQEIYSG